jgi:hypothetical protein
MRLSCRGTATVTTTERLTAHRHTIMDVTAKYKAHRLVVVRCTTFAVFAGKTYDFKVKLNDTGTRLLAKFKRLPATLT